MFNLKSWLALLAASATLSAASVIPNTVAKRDISCTFVISPSITPDPSTNLESELNWIFIRSLLDASPTGGPIHHAGSVIASVSDDGKYTVTDSEITSTGFTDEEVAATVTGFQGTTVTGLTTPAIDWTYESVVC
ncbi:hypothetical protein H1R20_g1146, partial [Candolleomyces eurysporus]